MFSRTRRWTHLLPRPPALVFLTSTEVAFGSPYATLLRSTRLWRPTRILGKACLSFVLSFLVKWTLLFDQEFRSHNLFPSVLLPPGFSSSVLSLHARHSFFFFFQPTLYPAVSWPTPLPSLCASWLLTSVLLAALSSAPSAFSGLLLFPPPGFRPLFFAVSFSFDSFLSLFRVFPSFSHVRYLRTPHLPLVGSASHGLLILTSLRRFFLASLSRLCRSSSRLAHSKCCGSAVSRCGFSRCVCVTWPASPSPHNAFFCGLWPPLFARRHTHSCSQPSLFCRLAFISLLFLALYHSFFSVPSGSLFYFISPLYAVFCLLLFNKIISFLWFEGFCLSNHPTDGSTFYPPFFFACVFGFRISGPLGLYRSLLSPFFPHTHCSFSFFSKSSGGGMVIALFFTALFMSLFSSRLVFSNPPPGGSGLPARPNFVRRLCWYLLELFNPILLARQRILNIGLRACQSVLKAN